MILAWVGALAILVGLVVRFINAQVDGDGPIFIRPMGKVAAISVGMMLLTTIPTPDRLWEIRIALLKLDLSSPENVKAVGGRVDEIVKALECKHLNVNCPKEAK